MKQPQEQTPEGIEQKAQRGGREEPQKKRRKGHPHPTLVQPLDPQK